jgi:signal transduction histidine kinase
VSEKLIKAHYEGRPRIGRELHDDVNPRLALLAVNLGALKDHLSGIGCRTQARG